MIVFVPLTTVLFEFVKKILTIPRIFPIVANEILDVACLENKQIAQYI